MEPINKGYLRQRFVDGSPIRRFADELAMYQNMISEQAFQEIERNARRDDDEGGASVRVPRAPQPSGSPAMAAV